MSYIQEFLSLHLPKYYHSTLVNGIKEQKFLDATIPNNIFDLTHEVFSLNSIHSSHSLRLWLGDLILRQFQIGYDCLRDYSLPLCPGDNEIKKIMKSSLGYANTMMVQLLLRLIRIFLECEESDFLQKTTLKMISEVGNIYPILKTEISINHDHIDLSRFIEKYLTLITSHTNSEATIEALLKIKVACNFTGSTERSIANLVEQKKKNTHMITKHLDFSSNDEEEDSDKQTKETKEKHFNEVELFRKKKPKIVAQDSISDIKTTALKSTKSMSTIEATPLKSKSELTKKTPRSLKRESILKNQNDHPRKKTPLLKKIKKPLKKPLQRTIYHAEIKKFIPKKGVISQDIFSIKESLTSNGNWGQFAFAESNKSTIKKSIHMQEEEEDGLLMFCVPETPKLHIPKKNLGRKVL